MIEIKKIFKYASRFALATTIALIEVLLAFSTRSYHSKKNQYSPDPVDSYERALAKFTLLARSYQRQQHKEATNTKPIRA